MTFLTVVGHVNVDIIFDVKEIPSFGSEEIKRVDRKLGGTGANIARYASILGTPVELISRVSRRFPEDLLNLLRNENLKLSLERAEEDGPTCYIADARNKQIAFMLQGPMNAVGKSYEIDSPYCHFASSNPDWILNLIKRSKSINVLDPGQEIRYRWKREKLTEAVRLADLVILNEYEFNYLSSFIKLESEKTIVTLADRGAIFKDELIGTDNVPARSTLGAGDMFRGALYAALYRGKGMKEAIKCANKVTGFYLKNNMDVSLKFKWEEMC
jgi:sugar/nucleoside kinase (ribokinase family)